MADVKGSTVDCKGQGSPPCTHTPNLLELQIQKPPKANGQPAWAKNVNIAGTGSAAYRNNISESGADWLTFYTILIVG